MESRAESSIFPDMPQPPDEMPSLPDYFPDLIDWSNLGAAGYGPYLLWSLAVAVAVGAVGVGTYFYMNRQSDQEDS